MTCTVHGVDPDLLQQAADVLRMSANTLTVNAALAAIVRRHHR
ncbi:hypothetical protein OG203_26665 [Nocardia sp. NBC_01499]